MTIDGAYVAIMNDRRLLLTRTVMRHIDIARLVGFKSRRIGMLKGQFEFDEKASAEMDKKIEALFTESERLPK